MEQTVGEVVGDYERLLRGLAERVMKGVEEGDGVENGVPPVPRVRGKRKVLDDEEDDDGTPEPKKFKGI